MKERVIIDCDPGIDDSLALMYALSAPELEVIGITIVCGNVPVDLGIENARKVCRLMGREDIPIYAGAEAPLKRPLVTAQDTHGMDGLGEAGVTPVKETERAYDHFKGDESLSDLPEAVQFIVQKLKEETLSIIAIGPLTNIAMALKVSPEVFSHLKRFVSMGGNFKSFGNCSPVAEFNYWVDPEGAKYVFEHISCQVEMVGLDVTRQIVLTPELIESLTRLEDDKADFIVKITKFYVDFHKKQEGIDGCVINDPLAIAYFIHKELCRGLDAYTTVETEGLCVGQSVVDEKGFWRKKPSSYVLTRVDASAFMTYFFNALFEKKAEGGAR
ncbi:MAG: nucleoside hydrolase [Lachnospiraceae bacterium]|nr:nucleoside hydrolase [Lachnospiraceae bacterium]